jgi:hypothetical protein
VRRITAEEFDESSVDHVLIAMLTHLEWHGVALGAEASSGAEVPPCNAYVLWRAVCGQLGINHQDRYACLVDEGEYGTGDRG